MLHRFRMKTLFTSHAELQEKWDIVKSNCPWFYLMRDLVGDYLENVVGATLQDGSRGIRKDATPDEGEGAEGDNHDIQEESLSDSIARRQLSPPASASIRSRNQPHRQFPCCHGRSCNFPPSCCQLPFTTLRLPGTSRARD